MGIEQVTKKLRGYQKQLDAIDTTTIKGMQDAKALHEVIKHYKSMLPEPKVTLHQAVDSVCESCQG